MATELSSALGYNLLLLIICILPTLGRSFSKPTNYNPQLKKNKSNRKQVIVTV